MNARVAPCKGCLERHPGCQTDECPRWKEWNEWQQERKSLIFKNRKMYASLRKIGIPKAKARRPAKLFEGKSHRKERANERMETRMAESDRFREEVRKREV